MQYLILISSNVDDVNFNNGQTYIVFYSYFHINIVNMCDSYM